MYENRIMYSCYGREVYLVRNGTVVLTLGVVLHAVCDWPKGRLELLQGSGVLLRTYIKCLI